MTTAGLLPAFPVDRTRWATRPPEQRGVARDHIRLLTARPGGIAHRRFDELPDELNAGDLLIVNTSPTRPAALAAWRDHASITVHLATRHDDGRWVVELRRPDQTGPVLDATTGEHIVLEGNAKLRLLHPIATGPGGRGVRLWQATLKVPGQLRRYIHAHADPIRYGSERAPLSAHQTVFSSRRNHPDDPIGGSAEMASAARPFTHRLVTHLLARGVLIAPITLHAGVSSQDADEPPQPEWMDVPATTASLVHDVRQRGHRIIAVGTTVTRALETAADGGTLRPRQGWTDLVLTPERGTAVVDGIITGWHEADASHLLLLRAVAGDDLITRAYEVALQTDYLWHEFGDSCLLLPS